MKENCSNLTDRQNGLEKLVEEKKRKKRYFLVISFVLVSTVCVFHSAGALQNVVEIN
jgi:hypothetical protein